MAKAEEQRRTPRVRIAGRLTGRASATIEVQVLDLSATGARVEHGGLLRPGTVCTFELPPALGQVSLSARVVRSAVIGTDKGPGAEQPLRYESGLEFIRVTPEQRAALTQVLE
jgi:hypothetical protein